MASSPALTNHEAGVYVHVLAARSARNCEVPIDGKGSVLGRSGEHRNVSRRCAVPSSFVINSPATQLRNELREQVGEALSPLQSHDFPRGIAHLEVPLGGRIGDVPTESRSTLLGNAMKWLALVLSFVFSHLHAAEVVDIALDARFDVSVAEVGSVKPQEFKHFGVYMGQPVDVSKEVVLFVHGSSGSPRDFVDVAGKLDTSKQQAWYAYYASGDAVAVSGGRLAKEVLRLMDEAGMQRIRVVAHSMGGLVAWHLVKALEQHMHVDQLVTVATPWGGHWGAGIGSMMSFLTPCRDSWHDLSPGSRTLQSIYGSQLETHFTLVYAVTEDSAESDGDGTISRQSQLAPGMRLQAEQVIRTVATHASVLTGLPAERIASLLKDKA
ncbi:hypothetical protein WDL1P1_00150 (plasmid) [Variovorax sp. WDL1]|nr:hypothetical protein WDL1P1_00150 [Variovorax sp. WDL1]